MITGHPVALELSGPLPATSRLGTQHSQAITVLEHSCQYPTALLCRARTLRRATHRATLVSAPAGDGKATALRWNQTTTRQAPANPSPSPSLPLCLWLGAISSAKVSSLRTTTMILPIQRRASSIPSGTKLSASTTPLFFSSPPKLCSGARRFCLAILRNTLIWLVDLLGLGRQWRRY